MKKIILIFLSFLSSYTFAQCEAGFTYDGDDLSVSFTDSSDGDGYYICDYNWDFGDGATSTDINPQHDYDTAGTYTVCLTIRTSSDSLCSDTVCTDTFCVDLTLPIINCQLALSYTQVNVDEACDGSIDLTVQGAIQGVTYEWSTGDDIEDLSDLCEGDYSVTVTDGNDCKDSLSIHILARDTIFYGRVFAKNNLLPKGVALLIDKNNRAVAKTTIDTGYYYFISYPDTEKYTIYAIPYFDVDEEYYPQYFPTYLDDILHWEDAGYTQGNSLNNDIRLKYYDDIYHGTGFVSGQVYYTEDTDFEIEIFNKDWFGNFTADCQDYKAANMTVLLINKNNEVVKSCLTNDKGFYNFKHIPLEEYTIYVEKSGKETLKTTIVLSEEKDSLNNINFTIQNKIVTQVKEFTDSFEENVNLYPNPFNEKLVLDFSDRYIDEIRIINIQGKEVFRQEKLADKLTLNTSNWSQGVYVLKVIYRDNRVVTKKIIRN